jgi:tyrosyl-tRNA synthetase
MEIVLSFDQQWSYLTKGFAEILPEEEFRQRLKDSIASGKPLRVKAGFDPTAPDLHLGHTVLIRKMKHFQDMGHTAIFLIGDMTGLIGDPTGRNAMRPPMTREEINANAETYKAQVFKLLDPTKTEIRFNSEWLEPMPFVDMIRLCSRYTVARLLERDDFRKRFHDSVPISVHEFLYPLSQAYDSVALECDIELGGTDQKFNLLVGREIMKDYGKRPQMVATVPILEGLDGVEKMSKSKANYVGITEAPVDMLRKLMNMPDALLERYYDLLTDLPAGYAAGKDPRAMKKELAERMIAEFHSAEEAQRALQSWGGVPSAENHAIVTDARVNRMMVQAGMASSVSEADRLVKGGGVSIGNAEGVATVANPAARHEPGEYVLKVGKKYRWIRYEQIAAEEAQIT